jgi:hypothetical protein
MVDKGVVSCPVGPPPKPRWEGWEGETDAMVARSYMDGIDGFLCGGDE